MKMGSIGASREGIKREEIVEAVLDDVTDARQALRNLTQELSNINGKMGILYDQTPMREWQTKLNFLRLELEDMYAAETRNLRILKRR